MGQERSGYRQERIALVAVLRDVACPRVAVVPVIHRAIHHIQQAAPGRGR